eukprot:4513787-Lingulodinium_polyedra.AAC.1
MPSVSTASAMSVSRPSGRGRPQRRWRGPRRRLRCCRPGRGPRATSCSSPLRGRRSGDCSSPPRRPRG